jgi:hypothetical protein
VRRKVLVTGGINLQNTTTVVMGPRVREDDIEFAGTTALPLLPSSDSPACIP